MKDFFHMKRGIIGKMIILVATIFVAAVALRALSNARTYQLFGALHDRVNTTQKLVALTFDDGPTKMTDSILTILDEQNIKATFFLIGDSIQQNFSETIKIVSHGHEVGNHSYSHRKMMFKSYAKIKEEIEQTDALIRKAGFKKEIFFRPPYGKKLFMLPFYNKINNRKTIMWDVDPDSNSDIAEDSNKIIAETIEKSKNGSIILLHPMWNIETVKALKPIILALKRKGFEFKTVSELL